MKAVLGAWYRASITPWVIGLITSAVLVGCTTTDRAIALDSVTTHLALAKGASELNPLLGDKVIATPVAAALISTAATKLYPQLQPQVCRLKLSVSANNLAALAGASFPESLIPAAVVYTLSGTICKQASPPLLAAAQPRQMWLTKADNHWFLQVNQHDFMLLAKP